MANQAYIEAKLKVNTQEFKKGMNEARAEASKLKNDLAQTGKPGQTAANQFSKTFASRIKASRGELVFLGSFIGTTLGQQAGKSFNDKFNSIMTGAIMGLSIGQFLGPWGTLIGAAVGGIGGVINSLIKDKQTEKAEIKELSTGLGIPVAEMEEFIKAASQFSNKETITESLKGWYTALKAFNVESEETQEILKQFGISQFDEKGIPKSKRELQLEAIKTTLSTTGLKYIMGGEMERYIEEKQIYDNYRPGGKDTVYAGGLRVARPRPPKPEMPSITESEFNEFMSDLSLIDFNRSMGLAKIVNQLGGSKAVADSLTLDMQSQLMGKPLSQSETVESLLDRGLIQDLANKQMKLVNDEYIKAVMSSMSPEEEMGYLEQLRSISESRALGAETDADRRKYETMTLEFESRIKSLTEQVKTKADNANREVDNILKQKESLMNQQQGLQSRLSSLATDRDDRNRLSLSELANSDVYTQTGARNREAARQAVMAERWAKQAMIEGREDLANQAQAWADKVRQSIDGLTSAERNPMSAILLEEQKTVAELKQVNNNLTTIQQTAGAMK